MRQHRQPKSPAPPKKPLAKMRRRAAAAEAFNETLYGIRHGNTDAAHQQCVEGITVPAGIAIERDTGKHGAEAEKGQPRTAGEDEHGGTERCRERPGRTPALTL